VRRGRGKAAGAAVAAEVAVTPGAAAATTRKRGRPAAAAAAAITTVPAVPSFASALPPTFSEGAGGRVCYDAPFPAQLPCRPSDP